MAAPGEVTSLAANYTPQQSYWGKVTSQRPEPMSKGDIELAAFRLCGPALWGSPMPVSTITDRLTGAYRSWFQFERVKTQSVGSVRNEDRTQASYNLSPGPGAGQADLAYAATRTVPANSADEFDLQDLEQTTLGVTVPFIFQRARLVRLVNRSTTAGRRLFVGADPGNPTTRYAAEVGPGSEWTAVNYLDGWQVTPANSIIRVANPNAASVPYDLYVIGVSATVPAAPVIAQAEDDSGDLEVTLAATPDDGGFAITHYRLYVEGVFDQEVAVGSPIAFPAYAGSVGDEVQVSSKNELGEGPLSDPFEVVAA